MSEEEIRCPKCERRLGTQKNGVAFCMYRNKSQEKGGKTKYLFEDKMLVECSCGFRGPYNVRAKEW